MSIHRFDDTELAAYLAGDLDEVTARRIDAALRDDVTLGRRLDRMHDVIVGLTQPDEVEAPAGLPDRIRAHARAAGTADARDADTGTSAVGDPPAPAGDELAARRSRARRVPGWIGGVAAAVAAVAVLGGTVVQNLGGSDDSGGDVATMESDEAEQDRSAAFGTAEDAENDAGSDEDALEPMAEDDAADGSDGSADEDAGEDAAVGGPSASDGPLLPEIALEDADAAADSAWADVREFDEGAAACREAVESAVGAPAVPLPSSDLDRDDGTVVIDVAIVGEPDASYLDGIAQVTLDTVGCDVLALELQPYDRR